MMLELQLLTRAVAAFEKFADAQQKLAAEEKRSNDIHEKVVGEVSGTITGLITNVILQATETPARN